VIADSECWDGTMSPRQPKPRELRKLPAAPRGTTLDDYRELVAAKPKPAPDNRRVAAGTSPWRTA
jgi:hypothetical protein